MKKYLAIGLILCASLMSGCSKNERNENFFYISKDSPSIVYDVRTDIVYYCNEKGYGITLTPFYGKDKQLVTKDEFIKNYMK